MKRQVFSSTVLDVIMSIWYCLRKEEVEEDQSKAAWVRFQRIFSTADNRSESKDGRREASVCLRKALREFGDDRSTFIEYRGHSGIVGNEERSN